MATLGCRKIWSLLQWSNWAVKWIQLPAGQATTWDQLKKWPHIQFTHIHFSSLHDWKTTRGVDLHISRSDIIFFYLFLLVHVNKNICNFNSLDLTFSKKKVFFWEFDENDWIFLNLHHCEPCSIKIDFNVHWRTNVGKIVISQTAFLSCFFFSNLINHWTNYW